MPFPKGKSGNPGGRRKRVLAQAIEQVGNAKNEQGITNKNEVAQAIWEIVKTKKFNGIPVLFEDWFAIVRWLGVHIDGPVPADIQVENTGEVVMRVVYENARDTSTNSTPETG